METKQFTITRVVAVVFSDVSPLGEGPNRTKAVKNRGPFLPVLCGSPLWTIPCTFVNHLKN